jgi:hypothetical protein
MSNRQDRRSVRAPRWSSMVEALYRQELRRSQWFKRPAAPKLTVRRGSAQAALLAMGPAPSLADHYRWAEEHQPGSYEWAKAHAHESATAYVGLNLHRPKFSTNWGTAHFAGKPYHWRQDYTGQLKLAAGESPW